MSERTGGCLCGAVRYRLDAVPATLDACHCGMCRKWSGGPGLGMNVSPDALRFESDATLTVYASSAWAERAFCAVCGGHLYYRMTAPGGEGGFVSLAPGTLDDPAGIELGLEIFVDRKPDGYAFAGGHERLTEAETLKKFGVAPDAP